MDSVVDLGIRVIRTGGQQNQRLSCALCLRQGFVSICVKILTVSLVGLVSRFYCFSGDRFWNPQLFQEILLGSALEFVPSMGSEIGVQKPNRLQLFHICRQKFRVIGHHRTVIMVVPLFFIKVIGHTRVKNGVDAFFQKRLDVSVHQLCRITDGVGTDGILAFGVQLFIGDT